MDKLSFLGLMVAMMAIFMSQYIEGANLHMLFNLPAFIIVLGGTIGAVILQTDSKTLSRAFSLLKWIFFPPIFSYKKASLLLARFSKAAHKSGLLEIDNMITRDTEPFVKNAMNTLLTGVKPEAIRNILEIELEAIEHRDLRASAVFNSMGGYSPTIGVLGAVLGLIQAMHHLHDQSELGMGIAAAFVATVYGVSFANLVFLPISNKLKTIILERSRYHDMIIEATVAIAEKENPQIIDQKLASFCYAQA